MDRSQISGDRDWLRALIKLAWLQLSHNPDNRESSSRLVSSMRDRSQISEHRRSSYFIDRKWMARGIFLVYLRSCNKKRQEVGRLLFYRLVRFIGIDPKLPVNCVYQAWLSINWKITRMGCDWFLLSLPCLRLQMRLGEIFRSQWWEIFSVSFVV